MSNQISTSAQSARENARSADGKFGQQEHDRADDLALFESLPQEEQDQITEWTVELDFHEKLWLTEGDLGPEVGPNTDVWIAGDDDTGNMVMSMAIDVPTDKDGKDIDGVAAFAADHGYTYKQDQPGLSTLTTSPVSVGVDPDKIRETMEQVDPGGRMRNDLAAVVQEHDPSAPSAQEHRQRELQIVADVFDDSGSDDLDYDYYGTDVDDPRWDTETTLRGYGIDPEANDVAAVYRPHKDYDDYQLETEGGLLVRIRKTGTYSYHARFHEELGDAEEVNDGEVGFNLDVSQGLDSFPRQIRDGWDRTVYEG